MDWNTVAAIGAMIAAVAAAITAGIAYAQIRQAARISKSTADQALELARFNAEFLSVQHLDALWQSQRMIQVRRSAAKALLQGKPNCDVDQILDFFEESARLLKRGVLPMETAWHAYYWPIANYWAVSSTYAEQVCRDEGASWACLPSMMAALKEMEARESGRTAGEIAPSPKQTEGFLEDECMLKLAD